MRKREKEREREREREREGAWCEKKVEEAKGGEERRIKKREAHSYSPKWKVDKM